MSFRRRITIVSATAVAIAVLLASLLTYLLASHLLYNQIDTQLRSRYEGIAQRVPSGTQASFLRHGFAEHAFPPYPQGPTNLRSANNFFGKLPARPSLPEGYQQLINARGRILHHFPSSRTLPISARTRALAAHRGAPFFLDATVHGTAVRILAGPLRQGQVLQVAESLTEADGLLANLRLILALLCAGGIAFAALLGRLVSKTAVTPVRRLTDAIEHVTETQDLSRKIEPVGEDEIGRLAVGFNAMLDALGRSMAALDESVHAQRQLVADASHELRTPVTSLRTNIEILQLSPDLDPDERQRLLADVVEQTAELSMLVNDLIDLARGDQSRADIEDLRLDVLVAEAVERAQRHAPETSICSALEPTVLSGVPDRLGRAVNNLIDNAIKYSPPGEPVEIELRAGELTVRDHGPGISAEDLPHVFDRFYRGLESRGRPGSGLGLAIVRQVIEQHRGQVSAEAAPGGGTLMRVRLAACEPPAQVAHREQSLHYSTA